MIKKLIQGKGSLVNKANHFRTVPSFYFTIQLADMSNLVAEEGFTEISGLSMSFETEPVTGGGMQDKQYILPKGISFTNLVLKRPLMIPKSIMANWCETTIQGGMVGIKPKDLTIKLLHPLTGLASATWLVTKAYPVKYEILGFNAEENSLAYEQIELAYQCFKHKLDMGSFTANTTAAFI